MTDKKHVFVIFFTHTDSQSLPPLRAGVMKLLHPKYENEVSVQGAEV